MTFSTSVAPLRYAPFRSLWLASVASNAGTFVQTVAASWLMQELTGSPLWVAAMAASGTLPLLFLALPAGALADILDRRKVMLASQVVMGIAATFMAALAFLELLNPPLLLGLGLLLGVGVAFNLPAWQAMVPDLVPRELVANAVALNSVAFNVARAVGPALGGLLVAAAGAGWAFLINSLSFLAVIVAVARLHWSEPAEPEVSSVASAIGLGVRYARFTPPFRRLLAVAAMFALTSGVVQSLLATLTAESLDAGAFAYGALLGAMGAGALLGAFTRGAAAERLAERHVGVAVATFGLAGIAVGLSPGVWLAGVALFIAGIAWVWTLATLNATVQLLVPAWVRGRAASLYTLAFVGVLPLGALLAGSIGSAFGTPVAYVVLGTGTMVLGLVIPTLHLPHLGSVVTPEPPEDWVVPEHADYVEGGPVMVLNTWVIDQSDLAEFLELMNEVRQVRLRTGAYRWRLYRNAEDPHRMTEVFLLASWEDHLRQHRRIDATGADLIRTARAFDRAQGPVGRHLVAIDVDDPADRPDWDQLVAVHLALHEADDAVQLEDAPEASVPRGATQK
jgi:MFS family permease